MVENKKKGEDSMNGARNGNGNGNGGHHNDDEEEVSISPKTFLRGNVCAKMCRDRLCRF